MRSQFFRKRLYNKNNSSTHERYSFTQKLASLDQDLNYTLKDMEAQQTNGKPTSYSFRRKPGPAAALAIEDEKKRQALESRISGGTTNHNGKKQTVVEPAAFSPLATAQIPPDQPLPTLDSLRVHHPQPASSLPPPSVVDAQLQSHAPPQKKQNSTKQQQQQQDEEATTISPVESSPDTSPKASNNESEVSIAAAPAPAPAAASAPTPIAPTPKRKPPNPPTVRTAIDHRRNIFQQQVSGKSDLQKKKLQSVISQMSKDDFQEIALEALYLDIAIHGDAVKRRALPSNSEKKGPHSMEEIIADVELQSESLKLRDATKEVVQDALTHQLSIYYGTLRSMTISGPKQRLTNSVPEFYTSRKKVLEGVEVYQYTPLEQKELNELKRIENSLSGIGRASTKVGATGKAATKLTEEDKKKNAELKKALREKQEDILSGYLRSSKKLVGSVPTQKEFLEFLDEQGGDSENDEDTAFSQLEGLMNEDLLTFYNIAQNIEVTSNALLANFEDEKRKEKARKERQEKDGEVVAKTTTKKNTSSSTETAPPGKKRRGEPSNDGYFDPAQHLPDVKKEEKNLDQDSSKLKPKKAPKEPAKKQQQQKKKVDENTVANKESNSAPAPSSISEIATGVAEQIKNTEPEDPVDAHIYLSEKEEKKRKAEETKDETKKEKKHKSRHHKKHKKHHKSSGSNKKDKSDGGESEANKSDA